MSANSGFVEYIIDLLSSYAEVKSRRMFGGYGLYSGNIMFAIIIEDELYFKVDDVLSEEYRKSGSYPFTYQKNEKTVALSYWYVPDKVFEDGDLLKTWFSKSLAIAIDKKRKK